VRHIIIAIAATLCLGAACDPSHEDAHGHGLAAKASPASGHGAKPPVGECGGQFFSAGRFSAASRLPEGKGGSSQPAPAYLDKMGSCELGAAPWVLPTAANELGKLNDKGDCASQTSTCHYHFAREFVFSSTTFQEHAPFIEIHCIVPNSHDGNRPTVFGIQVQCTDPHYPSHAAEHSAPPQTGSTCVNPLALFDGPACLSRSCCTNGTLTGVNAGGKPDLRPNFAICDQPIKLDCGKLLGQWHGHSAHNPHFGIVPVAQATPHHGGGLPHAEPAKRTPAKKVKAPRTKPGAAVGEDPLGAYRELPW
jgi:hypothetical protein